MTGSRPSSRRPQDLPPGDGPAADGQEPAAPPPSSAVERANRLSAANMLRSLLPLVVIILLLAGWQAFRQGPDEHVRTVDPADAISAAASRAAYPLQVPTGLPSGYRTTSVRTDAASAARQGAPVTLQIGYLTPKGGYAGFAESDDPRAGALTAVLDGARENGSVRIGGQSWAREKTQRGETALVLHAGEVTLVVTGSAADPELETVAGAVRPYSG
jgi:Protein of unknown function (DUF4245)